jgi:FlaA1/EpsC-like NDP-sugar epimerase/ActR/RegA family two-component response regulator
VVKPEKNLNRILVVDDDPSVCEAVQDLLAKPGRSIDVAHTLQEAKRAIVKKPYGIVVTDLNASEAGQRQGMEILQFAKEHRLGTEVLLLAGYESDEGRPDAEGIPDRESREKPFPANVLREAIGRMEDRLEQESLAPESPIRKFASERLVGRKFGFILDGFVLVGAFLGAYLLRFEFRLSKEVWDYLLIQVPFVVLLQFVVMVYFGIYTFIWRYVGLGEVKAFLKGGLFSMVFLLVLRLGLPEALQNWRIPISVIIMDSFAAFGGTLFLRVARRYSIERGEVVQPEDQRSRTKAKPVLLIGVGQAGVLSAKEILSRGKGALDIKGFLDDDPKKTGAVINGIRVLGTTDDLPKLVEELSLDHVIITIAHATRKDLANLVRKCERIPIKARIIPGLYEILDGKVEVSQIRDVQIEDLLGRDTVKLDQEVMRGFLTGKRVMVSGAGGSIGSELVRQVARFTPSALLLVDRAEFVLFDIDREIRGRQPGLDVVPLVADIGDRTRMELVLKRHRPQVIFHAAAHKHVPMMERNPCEAFKNNTLATRVFGELAGENGVEVFVFISTDKAVRPTSVMGATKRLAELSLQELQNRFGTRFVAVRFGNVLGSTGSVVPIFKEQIRKGGPVTVTHPEMVRYFMTISEASQLVMQAGAMGRGGEIFILDMGEPVRVLDLATLMISLSGFQPFQDIDIVFTEPRPGEKMFEELQTTAEQVDKTQHSKIFIGRIQRSLRGGLDESVARMEETCSRGDDLGLRRALNEVLPEADISPSGPQGGADEM